jgi:hypothetical protein
LPQSLVCCVNLINTGFVKAVNRGHPIDLYPAIFLGITRGVKVFTGTFDESGHGILPAKYCKQFGYSFFPLIEVNVSLFRQRIFGSLTT